jgi:hypothetical protein
MDRWENYCRQENLRQENCRNKYGQSLRVCFIYVTPKAGNSPIFFEFPAFGKKLWKLVEYFVNQLSALAKYFLMLIYQIAII